MTIYSLIFCVVNVSSLHTVNFTEIFSFAYHDTQASYKMDYCLVVPLRCRM
jgi:hypothetical protein